MKQIDLTVERLRELLHYDPETGIFTRAKCLPGYSAGSVAGTPDKDGYICIQIDGKKYKAHRLAWLYMTGAWPEARLDHRNTIRSDNWLDNLRDCSMRVNMENKRSPRADNKLGILGVSVQKGRFLAQIQVKGKKIFLGKFDTAQEAGDVYVQAKRELHEGSTL